MTAPKRRGQPAPAPGPAGPEPAAPAVKTEAKAGGPFAVIEAYARRLALIVLPVGLLVVGYSLGKLFYPPFRDRVEPIEKRFDEWLHPPAPKVLTPDMRQAIDAQPHRGRRVRAIKTYRRLANRIRDAKEGGADTAVVEDRMRAVTQLIQDERYGEAEELMNQINFVLPASKAKPRSRRR